MLRAMMKRGESIVISRYPFTTPTTAISASINAIIRNYAPDSGAASRQGYGSGDLGGVTQGDRSIIVMVADLQAQAWPLPVQKDDKILILSNNELCNVTRVDASKRAIAGAIELEAAGVA